MEVLRKEIEYVVFTTSKSEVVFVVSEDDLFNQIPSVDVREKELLVEFKISNQIQEMKDIGENVKNTILQDGGFSLFELNRDGVPISFHRFGRTRFDDNRDMKDLPNLLDRLTNMQPSIGKVKRY